MFDSETLQLLGGGVSATYFEGLNENALGTHLLTLKTSRACIDAVEANVLVALKRLREQTSPAAKHSDGADDLTERTGESRGEARKKTRRATLIDHHPAVAEALGRGDITAGHADALSGIPSKYREELEADLPRLLERAAAQSVDDFAETIRDWKQGQAAREGNDYHKSMREQRTLSMHRDRHSGLTRNSGMLDPESAAMAKSLLGEIEQKFLHDDQQTAIEDPDFVKRSTGQRTADGLVEICRLARAARAAATSNAEPTVIVSIPLSDLISGLGDDTAFGGGPVSAETARRLACEGGLIPAVLGAEGQILDLGRRTRLATPSQRLALLTHYGGCAVPSCDAAFEWCHMHHIDHWESGGATALTNLIPVCTRHHGQIHDGRLTIERDQSGADQWIRPTPAESPLSERAPRRRSCAAARPPRSSKNPFEASQAPGQQQALAV
jgi:hypothetical protein